MALDIVKAYNDLAVRPWAEWVKESADNVKKEPLRVFKSLADKDKGDKQDASVHPLIELLFLEATPALRSQPLTATGQAPLKSTANPYFLPGKCPTFVKDFGTVIDRFGETIDANNWRKALFSLLQIEQRFSAGDRVLTVAGAWAVTIAHKFGFPAAVAHHYASPILSVNPLITGVTIEHYSRYFYFLGLIAADYRNFDEACALFEAAVEVRNPQRVRYALTANKALLVVAAVARNEVAPIATEAMRNDLEPYIQFAATYLDNPMRLASQRTALGQQRDGLSALVGLVCEERPSQQILNLTKVYTNMPLAQVAASVGVSLDEAKAKINHLVSSGRIGADVDAATGFVTFSEVSTSSTAEVETTISRAVSLADKLEEVRTQVLISPDYVKSTQDFQDRLERDVAVAAAH